MILMFNSKGLAIGAGDLGGVLFVGYHLDVLQRAVILFTAVVNAFANCALNAGVCSFVFHNVTYLSFELVKSMCIRQSNYSSAFLRFSYSSTKEFARTICASTELTEVPPYEFLVFTAFSRDIAS